MKKKVQIDPGQISLHIIQMLLSAQIKRKYLQHIVKWEILTQLSEYRSALMMAAPKPSSLNYVKEPIKSPEAQVSTSVSMMMVMV